MFRTHPRRPSSARSARPSLEVFEDRCLLSGTVLQTNLVSDLAGVAQQQDIHLVNPWGISENSSNPFWVSDNNAGLATTYNTQGVPQSDVVNIPTPGNPTGNTGTPTGTVFNIDLANNGFTIMKGQNSGPAIFLFATEDGTILGWNPNVDPDHAIIAVDNSTIPTAANGAVYKGLAIGTDGNGRTLLYAANFRSGNIDVFNTSFQPVTTLPAGAFTDPNLPKGYAPFDIHELGGKLYVTYAKQNAAKHDDVAGAGHGYVDVFNLDGTPGLSGGKIRLISQGLLNSPWGLSLAPASFGSLAGALLVGNFGNGHINAYNATTGAFMDTLKDPDGEAIQINGLWGLQVGNGGTGGDANTVYFTAGLDHETHGLFGSLAPVAAGTAEGPAEAQTVQAALDVFQINLTQVIQDLSNGVTGATLAQDIQNLKTSFVELVQSETSFAMDQVSDGSVQAASMMHAEVHKQEDLFADFDSFLHHQG